MYRVFCESYNNYIKDFEGAEDDARLKISEPLRLITDHTLYKKEYKKNSNIYKLLCDILFYAKQNIERFPRIESFLWTIESRGIIPKYYGLFNDDVLEEHVKLINSFLKLTYWN